MNCLRVAGAALSATKAVAISRGVIGLAARRITSTALLKSVPRLNHGLLLLRRFVPHTPSQNDHDQRLN
jgi:hypothetical protein